MLEAEEILQRNVSGCTYNRKGKIIRVYYYGREAYYLDTETGTIKGKYAAVGVRKASKKAVKTAIKKAREWMESWDACLT